VVTVVGTTGANATTTEKFHRVQNGSNSNTIIILTREDVNVRSISIFQKIIL
jgi:hypothetical protein